ncbi:MAG: DUF58 domain-containing protein [Thiomonas sp.]
MSSPADSVLTRPAAAPRRWLRAALARRFDAWAASRHPAGGSTRLTHRNVYILPTRAGWLFAALVLVLLVLSINYQLNLGYLLTFLLAGSALMAMHVTHHNLRGLTLSARAPDALVHLGHSTRLELLLQAGSRDRWGLGLRADSASLATSLAQPPTASAWVWADCPRGGQTMVTLHWTPPRRGLLPWPLLTIESQYPLGVWTAWSRWRPQGGLLVLPTAEHPAPPLPQARPTPGKGPALARGGGEADGVRPYRSGDSPRHVLWKKLAHSDELATRDTVQPQAQSELWLDFAALPPRLDTEARLSRLCAWVLAADRAAVPYGLQLGAQRIAPATGAAHRQRCLRLLALHPGPLLATGMHAGNKGAA